MTTPFDPAASDLSAPLSGAPRTLDRDGILARIPHQGRMALLDRLEAWDARSIDCRATRHHDPDHPLRLAPGLLAPCAIEYAGQAMALHGALTARTPGIGATGYLASVRGVRFLAHRLDDSPGELVVCAEHLAGDGRQRSYRFQVMDATRRVLVEGRATVVLDAALGREGVR